jgi:hypothetical protein
MLHIFLEGENDARPFKELLIFCPWWPLFLVVPAGILIYACFRKTNENRINFWLTIFLLVQVIALSTVLFLLGGPMTW